MTISAYSIKNPLVAIFYLDDDFGNLWIFTNENSAIS